MKSKKWIKQGDVCICDLSGNLGSEQGGSRPVLVVQNNIGNSYSPTTIIVPLTKQDKAILPQHYILSKDDYDFLFNDSTVLCEQVKCIDISSRLERKLGKISKKDMDEILSLINKNFKL